jgi:hypothetical protein
LSVQSSTFKRLRPKIETHGSPWFIHAHGTGGGTPTKRGGTQRPAVPCLPVGIGTLSNPS